LLTSTHPSDEEKDADIVISQLFSQTNDKCGVKGEEEHEPVCSGNKQKRREGENDLGRHTGREIELSLL